MLSCGFSTSVEKDTLVVVCVLETNGDNGAPMYVLRIEDYSLSIAQSIEQSGSRMV